MTLSAGDSVAGYTVVRPLASGRTGEVYLAKHPRLPRQDAVKVLTAELSDNPVFAERFTREADAAATLWHPHIVGVHDRGSDAGRLWLAMDFVDGTDAGRLLAEQYPDGMPPAQVTELVAAAAEALDYARGQGVVHRQLDPSNIMVATAGGGRIALTDVGISGPEAVAGDGDDQYALAATAAWLLLGHPQRPGFALADERGELAAVDAVIDRGQSTSAGNRYPDCTAFAAALADALGAVTDIAGPRAEAPTQLGARPDAPTAGGDWWADAAPPEPQEQPVISYWTPSAPPAPAPSAPTMAAPGMPTMPAPMPAAVPNQMPNPMLSGPVPAYPGPYPTSDAYPNSGAYPAPVASAWPIPPMLLALLAIVGVIGVAVLTYAVLSNLA